MHLSTLVTALEKIAPAAFAESWDNVGLLAGDPAQKISAILLTIDYTPTVAEEARAAGCDLIVAYHPPIFDPVKRLTGPGLVFDAIRRGIAIYSPHTALDVAEGGTNDMLADAIGMTDREPLRLLEPKSTQSKLVVFVPATALETVSRALFDAGAGRIGNYSSCSFRCAGVGTFFGEPGAHPSVGQPGHLEHTDEVRLETLVPIARIAPVLRALRQSHPYEEPAFDLNAVAAAPQPLGLGRVGAIPSTARAALFDRIKRELDVKHLLIAGPTEGPATRAAVCAGSGGSFLEDALKAKTDVYLTGEIRHHDAVRAADAGMTVVCTLHSNSERPILKRLKSRLEQLPGVPPIRMSGADRDPFTIR